jgi:hypothetical protein
VGAFIVYLLKNGHKKRPPKKSLVAIDGGVVGGVVVGLVVALGCVLAGCAIIYPVVKDYAYNKTINEYLDSTGR